MPNIWWNSNVKPPEELGRGLFLFLFISFIYLFFHVNLTKFHNIIRSLAQDAINNAQFGAISVRNVPLVRNDKTEIKELNSLSIVRISISTYTQPRKKRVGSRMARISVAYSKSLPILEENDELSNIFGIELTNLSTQTNGNVYQLADSRVSANLPCKARMVKNSVQKKKILKLEIKVKSYP